MMSTAISEETLVLLEIGAAAAAETPEGAKALKRALAHVVERHRTLKNLAIEVVKAWDSTDYEKDNTVEAIGALRAALELPCTDRGRE